MEIQQIYFSRLNRERIGESNESDLSTGGRVSFLSEEPNMTVLKSIRRFLSSTEYNLKPGKFYNIQITESTDFDLIRNTVCHSCPPEWEIKLTIG